jgi:ethanolamine-phosphate cytidylyltransferase
VVTEDLLTTFGIGLVVRGGVHETPDRGAAGEEARYAVPRARGILRHLPSPSAMTSATLIQRIVDNRALFEARQATKNASEAAYYGTSKEFVDEV